LLDFEYFTALIGAAFGAGVVGQLALVAVGTLREAGRGQKIVGATLGRARLGVATLRIRHGT
jgi:hypothetical protein